ncbi:hypothetical protein JOB18_023716 [Solea senegalensis]|uniref:Uncharacterized protein n=1 Tax=Solea senegalensis TaxID=28829 RepID=A0AAV6QUD3_SOLSE|nr:hypothetical protein JOB18_023716 [Solea senegalensis]
MINGWVLKQLNLNQQPGNREVKHAAAVTGKVGGLDLAVSLKVLLRAPAEQEKPAMSDSWSPRCEIRRGNSSVSLAWLSLFLSHLNPTVTTKLITKPRIPQH